MKAPLILIAFIFFSIFLLEIASRVLNIKNNLKDLKRSIIEEQDSSKTTQALDRRKREFYYLKTNTTLGIVKLTTDIVLTLLFLFYQPWDLFDRASGEGLPRALFFVKLYLLFTLVVTLYKLPFSIFRVFNIERRFGFSSQSLQLFFTDILKAKLIELSINLPLIFFFVELYRVFALNSILLIAITLSLLSLIIFKYSVKLFITKFNKLSPLPDGDLRSRLEALVDKEGLPGSVISTMDASKRSSKANAFFAGIGKTRYIVLYDTILNLLSNEEITSVMAHEISHYRNRHTLKAFIALQLGGLLFFAFVFLFLKFEIYSFFIVNTNPSLLTQIVLLYFITKPAIFISNVIGNYISRKYEHEADKDALRFSDGVTLIKALSKLNKQALSNSKPHKLFVFLYYTHPHLRQRAEHVGVRYEDIISST